MRGTRYEIYRNWLEDAGHHGYSFSPTDISDRPVAVIRVEDASWLVGDDPIEPAKLVVRFNPELEFDFVAGDAFKLAQKGYFGMELTRVLGGYPIA